MYNRFGICIFISLLFLLISEGIVIAKNPAAPLPSYEPSSFLDPLHTEPGVPLTETLQISNIGDELLIIQGISAPYINGDGWIEFGSPSVNPIPVSGYANVDITFNGEGSLTLDPSGWDA